MPAKFGRNARAGASASDSLSEAIQTAIGPILVRRASAHDVDAALTILRDAAAWLRSRGINQWDWALGERGTKVVTDRVTLHETYLAEHDGRPVASVTLQWSDPFMWGPLGSDDMAGYVHGLAITRVVAGRGVGATLLRWAEDLIADRGRTWARLDCMRDNAGLCAYYLRQGYADAGTKTGNGWAARLFEKSVARAACDS